MLLRKALPGENCKLPTTCGIRQSRAQSRLRSWMAHLVDPNLARYSAPFGVLLLDLVDPSLLYTLLDALGIVKGPAFPYVSLADVLAGVAAAIMSATLHNTVAWKL